MQPFFPIPTSDDGIDTSVFEEVKRLVPENEPIATNVPHILAWHAEHPSLLVTDFTTMECHYPGYKCVFLPEIPKPLFDRKDLSQLSNYEMFLQEFKNVKDFENTRNLLFRRTKSIYYTEPEF